jgi:hypothetical protein
MPYVLLSASNNLSGKGMNISFRSTLSMQFAYIVNNFIFFEEEMLSNTITLFEKDMLY